MRNLKYYILILLSSCIAFMPLQSYAAPNSPMPLLEYVASNMIAGLKVNKATLKNKPQIVYGLANKYIVPHADLNAMSKYVLPPHIWNNATPAQREEFKKLFTRTLIRTYSSALTSYQNQQIKFYPPRTRGGATVQVMSEISGLETQTIQVSYRLIRSGGNWRLFDVSVEGVSMLESFRSQFGSILSQGNMQELLNRMAQHNRTR